MYIYVSNEDPNIPVYFDNLQVTHIRGPLTEENHYYPFGLIMTGIGDRTIKQKYSQNKYNYNGKELQNQEFSDRSGLEEYDFGARLQDPQLGKWWQMDPYGEKYNSESLYQYGENNPILNLDLEGKWSITNHYALTLNALGKKGLPPPLSRLR